MKISAIVLTRNEESNIAGCLKSLGFASEIIVIDNGSSDKTEKIAEKFTPRIIKFKGTDFSKARMLGREKARYEWLFYLDADELVSEELKEEILSKEVSDCSAFTLIRQNYFYGIIWTKKERIIRLIKKESLKYWHGAVHETPEVTGKIGSLTNVLLHYTHDDMSKMVDKTNLWSEIEAKARFVNNHPPVVAWRFARVMITSFFHTYIIEKAVFRGLAGLVESIYQSFSMFVTYAKLWELQKRIKKS